MMEEVSSKENLGFEEEEVSYRQHPAYANSDLKYLHSPKLFHLKKTQQLTQDSEDWQKTGTLIDEFLLSEDFNDKFIMVPDLETPSHANQHGIVDYILNLEDPLNPTDEDIIEAYNDNYSKPNDKKAKEMYDSLKDYIKFQIDSEGKDSYSKSDAQMLMDIRSSCLTNKWAKYFLYDEGVKRFKHLQIIGMEMYGIQWKGELDLVVLDFDNKIIYNIDIKSTSGAIAYFGYDYYKKWNYKRQQALYADLLWWHLEKKNIIDPDDGWVMHTRCLVVQSTGLHEAAVIPIPRDVYLDGKEELKEGAELIKFYQKNGWHHTISYHKNDGLEVMDWDKYRD